MDIVEKGSEFLKAVSNKNVLVDQYLYGKVDRIFPEAPVPILQHTETKHMPGGAANVALNLFGLDANVWVASVIGEDEMGSNLVSLLESSGVKTESIHASSDRRTTCKTRVMAGNQHLLRVDQEDRSSIDQGALDRLAHQVQTLVDGTQIDLVIFQDYNK